jgi:hypothetical protein
VSDTRKDSAANKTTSTILELVKRADETFDLFLNGTLHYGNIEEKWLSEELCVRFGFCGEEYAAILSEAMEVESRRSRFELNQIRPGSE